MIQKPQNTPVGKSKSSSTQTWLSIVLIILILVAAGYYIYQKNNLKITNPAISPTPTAVKSPSPSATAKASSNPTANWKTYTDTKYGITFNYPDSWDEPQLSSYDKPDELYFIQIANDYLDFNPQDLEKYYIQIIEISHLADYKDSPGTLENYNKLLNVYNNKTATGADRLWMPPSNAGIIAAGPPFYIENNDGSYRGVYYFGCLGQALSTNIDVLAILTNNVNVFQLHISMKSDKSAQYEPTLYNDTDEFTHYVESLTSSSDETVIREFNSTFQDIAKSIK